MRTIMLAGVALAIAAIAPGACKSNGEVERDQARKAVEGGEAGKAEPQTKPGKAAREFVEARDRFVEKLNAELVDLDEKIARLERDLESRTAERRAEVNTELADRIAELERKRDEAREALNQARSASEERWDQIKNRTNEIVHGIRDAYEDVARELRE
jgi:Skp family chaperone for outer membrane proteins